MQSLFAFIPSAGWIWNNKGVLKGCWETSHSTPSCASPVFKNMKTGEEKPKFFAPFPKSVGFLRIWGKAGIGVKAPGNIQDFFFATTF
jgi:hypothetical protein